MGRNSYDQYNWNKTGDTTWQTADVHRSQEWSGEIEYNDLTGEYTLTASATGEPDDVSIHGTLKRAKGHYRKFLHDKG